MIDWDKPVAVMSGHTYSGYKVEGIYKTEFNGQALVVLRHPKDRNNIIALRVNRDGFAVGFYNQMIQNIPDMLYVHEYVDREGTTRYYAAKSMTDIRKWRDLEPFHKVYHIDLNTASYVLGEFAS